MKDNFQHENVTISVRLSDRDIMYLDKYKSRNGLLNLSQAVRKILEDSMNASYEERSADSRIGAKLNKCLEQNDLIIEIMNLFLMSNDKFDKFDQEYSELMDTANLVAKAKARVQENKIKRVSEYYRKKANE